MAAGPIDFKALEDSELACLHEALGSLLEIAARETIGTESIRMYGGVMTAIIASLDEPKLLSLYHLGRTVHREIERRGLEAVRPHIPGRMLWPFSGMGSFARALKAALNGLAAA